MTKTAKIILWLLVAVIVGLVAYSVAIQDKVKAWNDLLQSQARIQELEQIIADAQFSYSIAETSKNECIESWDAQKEKAHDDAEKARLEIKELQGFLMSR
jgi:predicted Holliday junction resolvase-like endonuclease